MPLELHIIRTNDFIRLSQQGAPDLQASKEILTQLARTCVARHIHGALLDLRGLQFGPTPVATPVQLEELVNIFCQVGFGPAHRLAVLYATDPHHRARMFAFISKLHGLNAQVFDNYEQALGWLALTEEPIPEAGAG